MSCIQILQVNRATLFCRVLDKADYPPPKKKIGPTPFASKLLTVGEACMATYSDLPQALKSQQSTQDTRIPIPNRA